MALQPTTPTRCRANEPLAEITTTRFVYCNHYSITLQWFQPEGSEFVIASALLGPDAVTIHSGVVVRHCRWTADSVSMAVSVPVQ